MKRMSLFAVAALLFAGAQLHAQGGTKQDTTKKPAATAKAPAKQAGAAPTSAKTAAPATAKADAPAGGATKAKKGTSKKAAAKKDSTAKKP